MFLWVGRRIRILLPHPLRSRCMTHTSLAFQLGMVICLLSSRSWWILAWLEVLIFISLQELRDHTGKQWVEGSLSGKFAGVFVSTGSLGGGQEETGFTLMTTLVHQLFRWDISMLWRNWAMLKKFTEASTFCARQYWTLIQLARFALGRRCYSQGRCISPAFRARIADCQKTRGSIL